MAIYEREYRQAEQWGRFLFVHFLFALLFAPEPEISKTPLAHPFGHQQPHNGK
jgi:hypothetical protein